MLHFKLITSRRAQMEGEEFDARAIAQAVLAKVKVAHEVEADPCSKPADQDSVKFRESDG